MRGPTDDSQDAGRRSRQKRRISRNDWATAPEWISPKDAPRHIAQRYDVIPDRTLVQSLISAVRNYTVPHRVVSVKRQRTTGYLPPGLEWVAQFPDERVVISDWELAEVERLKAVYVNTAQTIDPGRAEERPLQDPTEPRAPIKSSSARSGRPDKYDWLQAIIKIVTQLNADGIPKKGDGGQARLEKMVADLFGPDNAPGETAIKKIVKETMAAFRQSMEGQGR
jgi:hypothetical protein